MFVAFLNSQKDEFLKTVLTKMNCTDLFLLLRDIANYKIIKNQPINNLNESELAFYLFKNKILQQYINIRCDNTDDVENNILNSFNTSCFEACEFKDNRLQVNLFSLLFIGTHINNNDDNISVKSVGSFAFNINNNNDNTKEDINKLRINLLPGIAGNDNNAGNNNNIRHVIRNNNNQRNNVRNNNDALNQGDRAQGILNRMLANRTQNQNNS